MSLLFSLSQVKGFHVSGVVTFDVLSTLTGVASKILSVTADTYVAMTIAQAMTLYSKFNSTIIVSDTAANIFLSPINLNTLFASPSVVFFAIRDVPSTQNAEMFLPYVSKLNFVSTTAAITTSPTQASKLISKFVQTVSMNILVGSEVEVFNNNVSEFVKYSSIIGSITVANGSSVTLTASQQTELSTKITGTVIINDSPSTVTVENYLMNQSSTAKIADTMGNISGSLATLAANVASITVTSGVPTTEDVANLVTYVSKIKSVNVDSGSFVTMTPSQANVLISKFSENSIIISVGSEKSVFETHLDKFRTYASIINSVTNVPLGSYVNMGAQNALKLMSKCSVGAIEVSGNINILDVASFESLASSASVGRITMPGYVGAASVLYPYLNTLVKNASKILALALPNSISDNLVLNAAQASVLYSKFITNGVITVQDTLTSEFSRNSPNFLQTNSIAKFSITDGIPTSVDLDTLSFFKYKINVLTFTSNIPITMTVTQATNLLSIMTNANATNSVIVSVGSESDISITGILKFDIIAVNNAKIRSITNVPPGNFLTMNVLQAGLLLSKISSSCVSVRGRCSPKVRSRYYRRSEH
jgi:hypothetical protein